MNNTAKPSRAIHKRFRGYLPVIIDVETAGFEADTHALLEIAAISVDYQADGKLGPDKTWHAHVQPFEGSVLDPRALEFNKIIPDHPFRMARSEQDIFSELFADIEALLKQKQCQKAILTGHNAAFDLGFLLAAAKRCQFKKIPFHTFSCLDTASLSALAFGQTVLAKGLQAAKIPFDIDLAHSALYDAEKTTELFCEIVNRWDVLNTGSK